MTYEKAFELSSEYTKIWVEQYMVESWDVHEIRDMMARFLLNNLPKEEKLTLEERKTLFKNELRTITQDENKNFVEPYTGDVIFKFYNYWTEHSTNSKKMKFEKAGSFEVSRRLKTWMDNQKKYSLANMLKNKR